MPGPFSTLVLVALPHFLNTKSSFRQMRDFNHWFTLIFWFNDLVYFIAKVIIIGAVFNATIKKSFGQSKLRRGEIVASDKRN